MSVKLYDYQLNALKRLRNGSILWGGVGSGKSITSLGYYYICNGGSIESLKGGEMTLMESPKDLYIITTARKRDILEWDEELLPFMLSKKPEYNFYKNKVVIDSWNNIKKYVDVKDAFFIFDEQRVVGKGVWVKSFIKIAKQNEWILLTATPGDTWSDYVPVFIANGYYKNRTEFEREHVIYNMMIKYPKISRYINTGRLIRLRNDILVKMDYDRKVIVNSLTIPTLYNEELYKTTLKTRWDPYKQKPIENAGSLCYILRKIVNSDVSKQVEVLKILSDHPKAIMFYNYDYELMILRNLLRRYNVSEWNGHKHEEILSDEASWAYLVQYTAGSEGWNCTETDTIIFFSENYSYKIMKQAAGRTDRIITPFSKLNYFHLISKASIDTSIQVALRRKKNFNENIFVSW